MLRHSLEGLKKKDYAVLLENRHHQLWKLRSFFSQHCILVADYIVEIYDKNKQFNSLDYLINYTKVTTVAATNMYMQICLK